MLSSAKGEHIADKPPPNRVKALWKRATPSVKSSVTITPVTLLLAAVVYGVLFFAMGSVFLPGNAAFCTLLIWICALVLANICHWLRVPRVMGMLGAGLLLANVPNSPVDAFPKAWGSQMRAAALATIFLRCGLELEFKTMAMYKWPALRLAFIPGICEALFDAGLGVAFFGMPILLACSMGFILKAVGPGLVVPAMFQLQKQRLGADKGIPSTVVIAASFDDIIAITGFSIFISLAITGQNNVAWNIAAGPLQVVFGIIGGIIAGGILGCSRVFQTRSSRLVGTYGACLLLMFFLEHFDMLSGGALGSLTVGMSACYFWESGRPRALSAGPTSDYSADIERVIAKLWDWVWEPLLFGTIGASIKFSTLSSGTVPYAIAIVVAGVTLRACITFVTMLGDGYSWKERLFYAIAWTPKATVQAALSAYPLTLIESLKSPSDPDYDEWVQWGNDILTTGVFAIIICGCLGSLVLQLSAPHLLEQQPLLSRTGSGIVPPAGGPQKERPERLSLGGAPGAPTSGRPSGQRNMAGIGATTSIDEFRNFSDQILLGEYFSAIDALVDAVHRERACSERLAGAGAEGDGEAALLGAKEAAAQRMEVDALCSRVGQLQQEVDTHLGSREMTVRQLLAASAAAAAVDQQGGIPIIAPGTTRHNQLMATLQELSAEDRPISSAHVASHLASIVIEGGAPAGVAAGQLGEAALGPHSPPGGSPLQTQRLV